MPASIVYKTCSKCKNDLPATTEHFHRDRRSSDGLYSQCKACKRQYLQSPEGKEKNRNKTAKWRATEASKEYQRKYRVKYRQKYKEEHPERFKASKFVRRCVDHGTFPPVTDFHCAMCGTQAEHYHHWSYKKEHWLDVIPLCSQCHVTIHSIAADKRNSIEARLKSKQPKPPDA